MLLLPNLSSAVCSYYCYDEYGAFEGCWGGINRWLKTELVFHTPRRRKSSGSTIRARQPGAMYCQLHAFSHNSGFFGRIIVRRYAGLGLWAHLLKPGRAAPRSQMAGSEQVLEAQGGLSTWMSGFLNYECLIILNYDLFLTGLKAGFESCYLFQVTGGCSKISHCINMTISVFKAYRQMHTIPYHSLQKSSKHDS